MVTIAAGLSGLAVLLWPPLHPQSPRRLPVTAPQAQAAAPPRGWTPGRRLLVAALAGCGALVFLSAGRRVCWRRCRPRSGPGSRSGASSLPAIRRERESVRRELPHVVSLLASALRGGAAPEGGLRLVAQALPGPASRRLRHVAARLALGADPALVWSELADVDPELAGLGRSMSRTHRSGAPVAAAVERLAEELARTARAEVEDRARAVGVKAALPLGICLLPAFVLIGIVPLVAGLMATVV